MDSGFNTCPATSTSRCLSEHNDFALTTFSFYIDTTVVHYTSGHENTSHQGLAHAASFWLNIVHKDRFVSMLGHTTKSDDTLGTGPSEPRKPLWGYRSVYDALPIMPLEWKDSRDIIIAFQHCSSQSQPCLDSQLWPPVSTTVLALGKNTGTARSANGVQSRTVPMLEFREFPIKVMLFFFLP